MAAQPPKRVEQPEQEPRKKKKFHHVKMELNVVPLVDVMFMMILFFVLGTRFRQNEGHIPATLPQVEVAEKVSDTPPEDHPKPTDVRIMSTRDEAGVETVSYQVGTHPNLITDSEELFHVLQGIRQGVGEKGAIRIAPGIDTRWQYAVEVFNQAVRADFKSIGFAS